MAGETLELVIAHEKAHLKRRDHLWKPLGFLLLSVYWFNPLCWVAYILLCRDIEAACDEKVIRDKDKDYIAAYSQALLDCSVQRRTIAACPLAFGETGVKERVKGVLNYKKPAFWVMVAAFIACVVVTVCFMTNPTNKKINSDLRAFLEEQVLDDNYEPYRDLGYEVFPVCDIEVIGTRGGDEIVVYAWVLDQIFSYQNGELKEESGGHIPTKFTVKRAENGYKLEEYWIPRDGAYYEPDIKDNFPVSLWSAAFSDTRYIEKQQERNRKKAMEYFTRNRESTEEKGDIARPTVNLSASEGADPTEILYSDKDRIIFSGYYGLFVYSKADRAITNAVDLEAIGCDQTQGDNYCEKFVSADGSMVFLHPADDEEMYVYHIENDSLSRERFEEINKYNIHNRDTLTELEHLSPGEYDVWDDHHYYTLLHHGGMLGELSYADIFLNDEHANVQWYPLFSPEGVSGAVDYAPEDIHDIVSAEIWIAGETAHIPALSGLNDGGGHHLYCDDSEVIAELTKMLSGAKEEKGQTDCPFFTALYLKRSDGTVGTVFPATDSCDMFNSGGKCYRMDDGTNEKLWGLIAELDEVSDEKTEDVADDYYKIIDRVMEEYDYKPVAWDNTIAFIENPNIFVQMAEDSTDRYRAYGIVSHEYGAFGIVLDDTIDGTDHNMNYIYEEWYYTGLRDSEPYFTWNDDELYLTYPVQSGDSYEFRTVGIDCGYDTGHMEFKDNGSEEAGETLSDWMSIDLPDDHPASDFLDTIGYMGGFVILPRVYQRNNEDGTPVDWQYTGIISRIPAENTDITFRDGIPNNMGVPVDNHTTQEYIGVIGLERSTNQWPAIMLKESNDLYTHAQIEEMKQKGVNIDDRDLTHDYWCFWFVKEGEDTYYVLKLSAKEFTENEATNIALSVAIK